jgi:23S rRNA (cytidine1920-2'-O)/16S rRNA (cytidine1409-2'-O)-methyltransferase
MAKERLDVLVAERGLAESRERAQRLILAGQVTVAGAVADKPGHRFDADAEISVKALPRFVGRGGDKLEGAFGAFALEVGGKICLDVGASTGGFTDCLLQHGAPKVVALDVGKGQLHWKLRNDSRVIVVEGVNARYLAAEDLPVVPSFAVVDVSFISLTKILPAVIQVLSPKAEIVALVKPQFEAGRDEVGRGGVVGSEDIRKAVVARIGQFGAREVGLEWLGSCASPLKGPAGNVEFFVYWQKP